MVSINKENVIINRRPIVFLAFFLILGITFAYYTDANEKIFIFLFWASIIALVLLLAKGVNFILMPLLFIAFSGGALLFNAQFQSGLQKLNLSEEYTIQGRVCDTTKKEYYGAELDNVKLIDTSGATYHIAKKVQINTKEKLNFGDIISFSDKINIPSAPRNPGAFDSRMYLASNGVAFSAFAYNVALIGHDDAWYFFPYKIRDYIEKKIDKFFTSQQASIAKAMVLGIRTDIPEEMKDEFSKTGISHVLAISGLHITLISAALNSILKRFSIVRGLRFSINIIFLIFYMIMTGFSSSVMRAVIISICIIIGRWGFYKRDMITYLSVAVLITLLSNTTRLFMPGFLMSYGVFFGLLCLGAPLNYIFEKINFQNYFSKLLCASLAASAAIFPLTAYFFKGVTLIAPIANFYAIPLTILIVLFTGLFAIFSVIPSVAAIIAVIPQISAQFLVTLNHNLSKYEIGYMPVEGFNIVMGVIIYAAIFFISDYVLIEFKKKLLLSACLCVCTGFYWKDNINRLNDYLLKLTFLDVGTGDDIHIKLPDKNYLIDNGGNAQYSNITAYTEDNGLTYDAIIISNDRTKNLKNIIEGGYTDKLLVPENYTKKEYDNLIKLEYYTNDEIIRLNSYTALQPVGNDKKHYTFLLLLNNNPICILAQTDAEYISFDGEVPIVKLADGGSKESINHELINVTKPEKLIISVKEGNKDKLPNDLTLKLINEYSIPLYSTDKNGAIELTVHKDDKITIETMK